MIAPRLSFFKLVVAEAPFLQRARAEILDDDVAFRRQLPQHLPAAVAVTG